jgi:hypothetical protein
VSLADTLVRFVSPLPPHDPEPHPDEPFAPVYDYRPLGAAGTEDYWLPDPCGHDPIVFGDVGRQPVHNPDSNATWRCPRCDVCWRGGGACWACGGPATGI